MSASDQLQAAAKNNCRGVIPVLLTPFDANRIDEGALRAEIEALMEDGGRAMSTGLASEIMGLDESERARLLNLIGAAARQRSESEAFLIAGSGGNSVASAVDRIRAAVDAGFDAVLLTPPRGENDEDNLLRYFSEVAGAAAIPVIVQDAAQMTGVRMSTALLRKLMLEVDGIVSIKVETPPTPTRILELQSGGAPLHLLGGAGGRFAIDEWRRGACGSMPGAGSALMFFYDVWQRLAAGAVRDAQKIFNRYLPLLNWSTVHPQRFLFLEKEILRRRGLFRAADVLAPYGPVSALEREEFETLLDSSAMT